MDYGFHYHVHKIYSLGLISSQLNPVHIFVYDLFKVYFNTILASMPRSPKWSLL
jgi:hypothetical protein